MRFIILNLLWICYFHCTAQEDPKNDSLSQGVGFGGPSSVAGRFKREQSINASIFTGYSDFKNRLWKEHHFIYSIDYYPTFQWVNSGLDSTVDINGGLEIYFRYNLAGRTSGNMGSFVFKIINRHQFNNNSPLNGLAETINYVGNVSEQSNTPWALTNLYWEQNFLNDYITFLVGILDAADYMNTYALVDPMNDFFNLAFSNDLSVSIPAPGFGLAFFSMLSNNLYILGSVVDANGDPTKPLEALPRFFNTAEYFSGIEFGWVKSLEEGYSDNFHVLLWHSEKRNELQIPSGWGLALSFNRVIAKKWSPFLRTGFSNGDGVGLEQSIAIGTGYKISDFADQLGLGFHWGRLSRHLFADHDKHQFTSEIFCRFDIGKIFALTPDIQFVVNPSNHAQKDFYMVIGLRGKVSL